MDGILWFCSSGLGWMFPLRLLGIARGFCVWVDRLDRVWAGSRPSVSVEDFLQSARGFVYVSLVSVDVIVCGLFLGSKVFISCRFGF